MTKKILPFILLLIGTGAGVGAGVFLKPDASHDVAQGEAHATGDPLADEEHDKAAKADDGHKDDGHASAKKAENDHGTGHDDGHGKDDSSNEFVKMNNQFVVPILSDARVTAMVVIALSIEVPPGYTDVVFRREPKLRDSFLQVLFDHANMGGFDGAFTSAQILGRLRSALREVAQKDLGEDVVQDILIVEIARQDY